MTINLEKELLKQNAKLVTPKELLKINEFERVQKFIDDDSLSRIGISTAGKDGRLLKKKADKLKSDTNDFDQKRVFHISQIEKICDKYYLKFLPSCLFNGQIDEQLPFKINNFEATYGVKCVSAKSDWGKVRESNTFIMAPPESFDLTPIPLDPLLFYMINEEYFYLIHKRGNDLSITRMLKALGSYQCSISLTILTVGVILNIVGFITQFLIITHVLGCIALIASPIIYKFALDFDEGRFIPKNKFRSHYKKR